jgi:uncharacterized membrane protein
MRKLFVHRPLFRLLSPIFSGIIVYLLILLFNNEVGQLQEQFLGEDLYVCIGLSYIIQEFSRLLIVLFEKLPTYKNTLLTIVLEMFFSVLLTILIVTVAITLYYKHIVGFSVTGDDLWMFNSIFSVITLIYIALYISYLYLHKMNADKLKQEERIKRGIEEDFHEFKKGINPDLLFESFEALLVLIEKDVEQADDFIDYLATIYRYLLSSREKQLVPVEEEFRVLLEFEKLMNTLPYRSLQIQNNFTSDFLVVPGSFLFIIEKIIKGSIVSKDVLLQIKLTESEEYVILQYEYQDKIQTHFNKTQLKEIIQTYSVYSKHPINLEETASHRTLYIPKLLTKR